ncbi:MAG: hypothetical protein I3I97_02925 [Bifidobacterium thermophilum]|nr:hypothetical protein [Bifidobacterium thermophilum]
MQLTETQRIAKTIFCLLAGIILMILGAWAMTWLIWGIITIHAIGTLEGLMALPCWLLGIVLLDIAEKEVTR